MKRPLFLGTVAFVAVVNGIILLQAVRNRAGAPLFEIELTERELPLEIEGDVNTAAFLRLDWERSEARDFGARRDQAWITEAKLRELGLDPGPPESGEGAQRRFDVLPGREVFVVLEYRPGEMREAEGRPLPLASRLLPVDAGLDAGSLRSKYADPGRHLIARGVVRASLEREWQPETRTYRTGAVRGRVQLLSVSHVHVPLPHSRILAALNPAATSAYRSTDDARTRGPRYAATLAYGRNFEPWVKSVRLLP